MKAHLAVVVDDMLIGVVRARESVAEYQELIDQILTDEYDHDCKCDDITEEQIENTRRNTPIETWFNVGGDRHPVTLAQTWIY